MIKGKEKDTTSGHISFAEREIINMKKKQDAFSKALEGEKIRYKSPRNPDSFVSFLKDRLEIWEQIKDKTFHGKRMYEKTSEILESKKFGVE
jgi:hypothetical protein